MTFSVVARCAETGMFGVAVSSSSPAVAARCAYTRAGVGACASQNVTDPRLGPKALDLLAMGLNAREAIDVIARTAEHGGYRQVLVVDWPRTKRRFIPAKIHRCTRKAHRRTSRCAGNLLDNEGVPQAMVDAFHASSGHLGDRLVHVMRAALAAGGEAGPVHSAGMQLCREVPWPVADLRVD